MTVSQTTEPYLVSSYIRDTAIHTKVKELNPHE
jgi:hypothetical protein